MTKPSSYYTLMFDKVARHKANRATRVAARKARWIKRRVKKNGEPVRGIEITQ